MRRLGWFVALLVLTTAAPVEAARIGEMVDWNFGSQAARFFSLQDPSVRYALGGSVLLGLCCGLMGAFLVVRKLALMGDALSHAVLPGVALGFLWGMTKNPAAIFAGAVGGGVARRGRGAMDSGHHETPGGCGAGVCPVLVFRGRHRALHHDPEFAGRGEERVGWLHVRPGSGARSGGCVVAGRSDRAGLGGGGAFLQRVCADKFRRGVRAVARVGR